MPPLPPALLSYLKEQLGRGYSPEQLRGVLIQHGWPAAMVEEALTAATTPVPPAVPPKSQRSLKGRLGFLFLLLLASLALLAYWRWQSGLPVPILNSAGWGSYTSQIGTPGYTVNYPELWEVLENGSTTTMRSGEDATILIIRQNGIRSFSELYAGLTADPKSGNQLLSTQELTLRNYPARRQELRLTGREPLDTYIATTDILAPDTLWIIEMKVEKAHTLTDSRLKQYTETYNRVLESFRPAE
jgi:hypothetical protein